MIPFKRNNSSINAMHYGKKDTYQHQMKPPCYLNAVELGRRVALVKCSSGWRCEKVIKNKFCAGNMIHLAAILANRMASKSKADETHNATKRTINPYLSSSNDSSDDDLYIK